MDQQSIVVLLSAVGVVVSLGSIMLASQRSLRTELKGDIGSLRTELKGDITDTRTELKKEIADTRAELISTRTELKSDIGKLGDRMSVIEQRTYDLRGLLSPVPQTGS